MFKSLKRFYLLVLVFTLSFMLAGCGGPNPEDAVKKFFDSMKKADFQSAGQYIKNDEEIIKSENPAQEKALVELVTKLNYEIVSSEIKGDKATVKTKVTAPNMPVVLGKIMGELIPQLFGMAFSGMDDSVAEDLFNDALEKSLSSEDVPLETSEVELNLVLENDKWLIVGDDNVANAITGNLVKAFADIDQQMSGEEPEIQADPKVYRIGEEVQFGRASFTVVKVEKSQGKDYSKPGEGNEFVIVTIKKKNTSEDTLDYNLFNYSVQTSNGQILEATFENFGREFGSGSLAANGVVEGNITFEVPKGDDGLLFLYTPDFEKKALLKFDISN